jgi:large subunit ribosomal protein L10
MTKEDKNQIVNEVAEKLQENKNFYVVDAADLTVVKVNAFRRECFKQGIELKIVKNTLIEKALERVGITEDFSSVLKGPSGLMFSDNATAPAKLIKDFRKKASKPAMKAAYIEESLYVGDEQLDAVINIKSKQVLLGELIATLQSPMQNVLSGLKGQGAKIAGILKTLEERTA